jgi:ABC-2 type transport system permease protein
MNAPSLPSNLPMSAAQNLRLYALEAWYELLRMARTPAFVIPTLAFPVVFYLMFAVMIPGQWGSFQKATYLFATYGVFGVIGPALFGFGVGMAMERESGLLELKRVSPMPIAAYFVAKIAMSLIAALCVVLLLSAAAMGLGEVRMALGDWTLLLCALMLGALPFCALGLLIGSLVKGQAAVGIVNLIYLPMSVLSGLWMPLFAFPEILQKLAVVWPAWHLAQLALGISGQIEGVNVLLHSAVLIGFTVFFLALAALRLKGR